MGRRKPAALLCVIKMLRPLCCQICQNARIGVYGVCGGGGGLRDKGLETPTVVIFCVVTTCIVCAIMHIIQQTLQEIF